MPAKSPRKDLDLISWTRRRPSHTSCPLLPFLPPRLQGNFTQAPLVSAGPGPGPVPDAAGSRRRLERVSGTERRRPRPGSCLTPRRARGRDREKGRVDPAQTSQRGADSPRREPARPLFLGRLGGWRPFLPRRRESERTKASVGRGLSPWSVAPTGHACPTCRRLPEPRRGQRQRWGAAPSGDAGGVRKVGGRGDSHHAGTRRHRVTPARRGPAAALAPQRLGMF